MNARQFTILAGILAVAVAPAVLRAQTPVGTAFTYQGQLKQSGVPVDELADLEFTLWDADVGGGQVGPTLRFDGQSHTPPPVDIDNGLFTVVLDFGEGVFTGDARWLEIRVAVPSGSGTWETLSPRQELTPVPHALALRALRTDHDAAIPDVIGGYRENSVTPGVSGATISGGGGANSGNRVTDSFGTVGGGLDNQAGDDTGDVHSAECATVSGGGDNIASAGAATVAGGFQNTASEANATVGGGYSNTASGSSATISGGFSNEASGDYGPTVGGGSANTASARYATVGGGYSSTANADYATVGGGYSNTATANYASVPGGLSNAASGLCSFAAGRRAKANHDGTFVWADDTNADFASTGTDQFLIRAAGGVGIGIDDPQAMLHVGGTAGVDGIMFPDGTLQTTAVGGSSGIYGTGTADYIPKFTASNTIGDSVIYESGGNIGVGTTDPNSVLTVNGVIESLTGGFKFPDGSVQATAAGEAWSLTGNSGTSAAHFLGTTDYNSLKIRVNDERALWIRPSPGAPNIIGGYYLNFITDPAEGVTIGGGGGAAGLNWVTDSYGIVGGGAGNRAGDAAGAIDDACYATVCGGHDNSAAAQYGSVGGGSGNSAAGEGATIGGGSDNACSAPHATVAGGFENQAEGLYATIAGGWSNHVASDANSSCIAGGEGNLVEAETSTIGGGYHNTIGSYAGSTTIAGGAANQASATAATVGGGTENSASGVWSAVSGGWLNEATGDYATVPGGRSNEARGDYSFAAGYAALADWEGMFVWADTSWLWGFPDPQETNFTPGPDQFLVQATGGTVFVSAIGSNGASTAGVQLPAGGSAWSSLCDRSLKENFRPADGREVLASLIDVPIQTWNYKSQDPSIRHVGPIAQDFYAAFSVGEDDKHISTVDADGVALAAIQGLYELIQDKEAEIAAQRERIGDLSARLDRMEALLAGLAATQDGGAR